jgi:hypothetical protein
MPELVTGLPDMLGYYTIGNSADDTGAPGPMEFLPALLEALTGIQVALAREPGEPAHSNDAVAWVLEGKDQPLHGEWSICGRYGNSTAGFKWRSEGWADDSSAYVQTFTSYGLPITLTWSMQWRKSGYVHRFHHGSLTVEFASTKVQATFHEVWQRVFGKPALLS